MNARDIKQLEAKVQKLQLGVASIKGILYRVEDAIGSEQFLDARADLSEASNEIDNAMGLIDEITEPESHGDY